MAMLLRPLPLPPPLLLLLLHILIFLLLLLLLLPALPIWVFLLILLLVFLLLVPVLRSQRDGRLLCGRAADESPSRQGKIRECASREAPFLQVTAG